MTSVSSVAFQPLIGEIGEAGDPPIGAGEPGDVSFANRVETLARQILQQEQEGVPDDARPVDPLPVPEENPEMEEIERTAKMAMWIVLIAFLLVPLIILLLTVII